MRLRFVIWKLKAIAKSYMVLVFIISRGFKLWEKHWLAHLRPREVSDDDKKLVPDRA